MRAQHGYVHMYPLGRACLLWTAACRTRAKPGPEPASLPQASQCGVPWCACGVGCQENSSHALLQLRLTEADKKHSFVRALLLCRSGVKLGTAAQHCVGRRTPELTRPTAVQAPKEYNLSCTAGQYIVSRPTKFAPTQCDECLPGTYQPVRGMRCTIRASTDLNPGPVVCTVLWVTLIKRFLATTPASNPSWNSPKLFFCCRSAVQQQQRMP